MSGIEERIAEVLIDHQRRVDCNHPAYGQCYCRFNPEDDEDLLPHEAQANHVAAILVAELGLTQEWRVADADGPIGFTHISRKSAEHHVETIHHNRRVTNKMLPPSARERPDPFIVSRYVTGWEEQE